MESCMTFVTFKYSLCLCFLEIFPFRVVLHVWPRIEKIGPVLMVIQ